MTEKEGRRECIVLRRSFSSLYVLSQDTKVLISLMIHLWVRQDMYIDSLKQPPLGLNITAAYSKEH